MNSLLDDLIEEIDDIMQDEAIPRP